MGSRMAQIKMGETQKSLEGNGWVWKDVEKYGRMWKGTELNGNNGICATYVQIILSFSNSPNKHQILE